MHSPDSFSARSSGLSSSDGLPQSTPGDPGSTARTVSLDFALADVFGFRLSSRLSFVFVGTLSFDLAVPPLDFGVLTFDFGVLPLDFGVLALDLTVVLPLDLALALPPPRLDTTLAPESSSSDCSLSWCPLRLPARSLPLLALATRPPPLLALVARSLPLPVLAPPGRLRLR